MKVEYIPTNQEHPFRVIIEEDKQVDVFKQIAQAQELFRNMCATYYNESTGKYHQAKPGEMRFQVRENEGNEYLEVVYEGPDKELKYRKLQFSTHNNKEGTLFPKRYEGKPGEGKWLPNRGWVRWNKELNNGEGGYE